MKQRVFNKKHMDVLFNWFYSMYVCMYDRLDSIFLSVHVFNDWINNMYIT